MAKILGIGNALVDILIQLPDDKILNKLGIPKGSMNHVDQKTIDDIIRYAHGLPVRITSGGSAANSIHGLARLGNSTSFLGKTGNDDFGRLFTEDMHRSGIEPLLIRSESDTGIAVAMISQDYERTFAVALGAAKEMGEHDIQDELFVGFDLIHIEGYLVQNKALIEKIFRLAKSRNISVSLDLASFNVVEENKDFFSFIIPHYVDIVFANETEAKVLTGLAPEAAVSRIASWCDVAVVKTGANGSFIQQNSSIYEVVALPSAVIDTTGAGDLYAAGFLHGLLNGWPVEECGRAGTLLASRVIETLGGKIPEGLWGSIIARLENRTI